MYAVIIFENLSDISYILPVNRYTNIKIITPHEPYSKNKNNAKVAYIGSMKNKTTISNLYKNLILNLFLLLKNNYIPMNSPLIISSES